MTLISIILPTNRLNSNLFPKIKNIQSGLKNSKDINILTNEFIDLISYRLFGINHYLEMTLNSLGCQTFKDFELVISHRYPEDALDIVKKDWGFPIRLVREKPSIWHNLGSKYGTLCNNINTAVIHSSGKLLWRLDDLTFFNNKTLEELVNLWKKESYATSKGIRCIDYDTSKRDDQMNCERIGANKFRITGYGWRGEDKPLAKAGTVIDKQMCWGFSSTVSIDEFLKINGHDELYDGCVCGTDMDLGYRLSMISPYNRVVTENYIYEINDVPYKYMMRDDIMMRQLWRVNNLMGNSWKPSPFQLKKYEIWHKKTQGELDPNWNKFMDVPYIDMKKEYELKRLGEVIYESK